MLGLSLGVVSVIIEWRSRGLQGLAKKDGDL